MMAFEIQDGQVYIFRNKYHDEAKNTPTHRGELKTPDGQLLQISLWVYEGKNGKYFQGQVQEKQERTAPPKQVNISSEDFDDDINS